MGSKINLTILVALSIANSPLYTISIILVLYIGSFCNLVLKVILVPIGKVFGNV